MPLVGFCHVGGVIYAFVRLGPAIQSDNAILRLFLDAAPSNAYWALIIFRMLTAFSVLSQLGKQLNDRVQEEKRRSRRGGKSPT